MNRQSTLQTTAETQRRREPCRAGLPDSGRSAAVPVSDTRSRRPQKARSLQGSAFLRLCGGFPVAAWLALITLCTANVYAQLPEGPGREETEQLCKGCHELERSVSRRQDRDGWQATINKMVAFGTKGSDQEFALILDYLTKHYPAEAVPPVNVNTAAAIEMESRLSLRRSQAAAIIAYRTKNGKFKSIEDLKKVPGVDVEKIEAKKDRIVF